MKTFRQEASLLDEKRNLFKTIWKVQLTFLKLSRDPKEFLLVIRLWHTEIEELKQILLTLESDNKAFSQSLCWLHTFTGQITERLKKPQSSLPPVWLSLDSIDSKKAQNSPYLNNHHKKSMGTHSQLDIFGQNIEMLILTWNSHTGASFPENWCLIIHFPATFPGYKGVM